MFFFQKQMVGSEDEILLISYYDKIHYTRLGVYKVDRFV